MPIVPIDTSPAGAEPTRPLPPVRHRVRVRTPPATDSQVPEPPAEPSNYVVGYGRPPTHTRFKPGSSGNPRGRPKAAKGLKTLARDVLTTRVPVRTASGERKMHRIEAVLHKTVELAMKGNPRALAEVLKLYASAVPESAVSEAAAPVEELTAGDLAILEELKTSFLQDSGR